MTWLLPVHLLPVAGGAALVLVPSLVRRPVSASRLVVDVVGTALAVIALFWLGWVLLSLVELRW
jgi:hypothetical protein